MNAAAPRVLHRTARPISVDEFVDALQATCPPRFPGSRASQPRPVALAISGGVDSMALAYLCWRAHREHMRMRVADNPVAAYYSMTVDHRLREGSEREASAVAQLLHERFGMRAWQLSIHWREALEAAGVSHPKDLPSLETVARRLRYRRMALVCAQGRIASMFLAHHQDDQYETVLMRLMSGHGRAGLLGMRPATDIPECHDIYGAYQSGFVGDQLSTRPMINYRPTRQEARSIRAQITADLGRELYTAREVPEAAATARTSAGDELDAYVARTRWAVRAAPLDVEDGGVMIYRPLLEFPKDRLAATCEANGVPWFEDATNEDQTLTLRNAVRHLWTNHTLPVALQKPAVLDMSNRLRRQAASDEAEVDRLLRRTVLKDFESVAGTVVVQLPSLRPPSRLQRGPGGGEARRQKRLEHYRRIAILLVKRLIAMVTPEPLGSFSSSSLPNTVPRLFPSLNDDPSEYPKEPKAFNVSGVHFVPMQPSSRPSSQKRSNSSSSRRRRPGPPLQWFLTRQPYVSGQAPPQINCGRLRLRHRWRRLPDQWRWPAQHGGWKLWDGRFWVTIRNRSPLHAAVAPFDLKHAKAFRDSLPDDRSRAELTALLKMHAPGKVRYTLPAIYTGGDLAEAVGRYQSFAERRRAEMLTEAEARRHWAELTTVHRRRAYLAAIEWERARGNDSEKSWAPKHWARGDDQRTLVALPTLGIARPGLQNWIRYDIRYRRVDRRMLEHTLRDEDELVSAERARAQARSRSVRNWAGRWAKRGRSKRRRRPPALRLRMRMKMGEKSP